MHPAGGGETATKASVAVTLETVSEGGWPASGGGGGGGGDGEEALGLRQAREGGGRGGRESKHSAVRSA